MAGNGSHHQPEPQAGDLPSWATAALDAAIAALDTVPKNSEGSVESAQVRGPIPSGPVGDSSHNYPFFSALQDLASYGYTEEEFFFSGTTFGGPYTSRMLVRRPTSPAQFSGTVFVEWLNVTFGYDVDALWVRSADQILRDGDAYIAVDAQIEGLSRLKGFNPKRYECLDIPNTGKSILESGAYGIFAQALQTIRHPLGANPLGGLPPKTIVATGNSQSAGTLWIYSSTFGITFPTLVDAYLITGLSTITLELGLGLPPIPATSASFPFIVADHHVPVFILNTETDPSFHRSMPDSATFRLWEVAGSSHLDHDSWCQIQRLAQRDLDMDALSGLPCAVSTSTLSRIPFRYAQNAALVHITHWARTGTPPPSQPGFTYTSTGTIVRDSDCNALGGVRLPEQDVPTATNRGDSSSPLKPLYGFLGQYQPFTPERLQQLYPNHTVYVQQVRAATERAVAAGVLLPPDASEVIATAEAANNIPPATSPTPSTS
ncbi:MAG: alpha/beta hydrolase domain-containing protein [Pseudonocardiaceae bacterium]